MVYCTAQRQDTTMTCQKKVLLNEWTQKRGKKSRESMLSIKVVVPRQSSSRKNDTKRINDAEN